MAYLEQTQKRSTAEPIGVVSHQAGAPPKPTSTWDERWLPPLMFVLLLASWELSVARGWISALFFPAPTTILRAFIEQLGNGELLAALWTTFGRLLVGLLSGGVIGLFLGAWMGWSRRVRTVLDPFVAALHAVPKLSILPLVMILFGIGETSKIVLVAITACFPLLLNTMTAVQQINPLHLEVARHYGASGRKLFQRVIFPASLPLILTGVRLALNAALVVTIGVELLSAREGLGAMIWLAWQTLRTEELYVALFTTALIGIGFNHLLQWYEKKVIHWR